MSVIQGIYIALFGRPADPAGLAYWNEVTKDGADLAEMLRVLPSLDEYTSRFTGQSNEAVIKTIYQSLFNREPEPEGLAFFLEQLASGAQNMATIAVNILQGARGDDKADIDAKIEAAVLFTNSLDEDAELAAYDGETANDLARGFLDGIDKDNPATLTSIEEIVTEIVTQEGNVPNPGTGGGGGGAGGNTDPVTRDLTTGEDRFGGRGGEDTFNAKQAGSLNSSDFLNGWGGRDTLNIEAGARADDRTDLPEGKTGIAPTLIDIEVINNHHTSGSIDLAKAQGVEEVWTHFSKAAHNASHYYFNASADTVFGMVGNSPTYRPENTLSLRFQNHTNIDTLNFALKDTSGYSVFAPGEGTVAEKVMLSLDSDELTEVSLKRLDAGEVIVTGTGDLHYIYSASSSFDTFDARGLTGKVSFGYAEHATDSTIYAGGAADQLNFGASTKNHTLDGGLGADTITGGSGNNTIRGGAGDDTINLSVGGVDTVQFNTNISSNGTDTITGFTAGAGGDKIQIDGATSVVNGGAAISYTVNDEVSISNAIGVLNFSGTATAQNIADEFYNQNSSQNNGQGQTFNLLVGESGYVVSGTTGSTTVQVWHINNTAGDGITADEVNLLGTITLATGNIASFTADNFAF